MLAPALKEASSCQLLWWDLFPHFSWKVFSSLASVPPHPRPPITPRLPDMLSPSLLYHFSESYRASSNPFSFLKSFCSSSGSGNCSLWWTPGPMVLMLLDILDILLIIFSPLFVCLLCFLKNNVLGFVKSVAFYFIWQFLKILGHLKEKHLEKNLTEVNTQ